MYPQGYTTGDEDDTAGVLDKRGQPESLPTYKGKYMGDMADYTLEQIEWGDPDEWDDLRCRRPETPDGFWRMKDGKLKLIRSMTDSHLRNAIALSKRMGYEYLAVPLEKEVQRRAELVEAEKEKSDPVYHAFKRGWNAGHRSATEYHCPDIGMSMPETLNGAWEKFKKENKL